jgi:hypothetical protein
MEARFTGLLICCILLQANQSITRISLLSRFDQDIACGSFLPYLHNLTFSLEEAETLSEVNRL